MKKMFFAEPEMEVVHFDAEDVIATSCQPHSMGKNDDPISGCSNVGIIYGD